MNSANPDAPKGPEGRRWFLDQDQSSHWYLVPVEHLLAWQDWGNLPEHDERSWDAPEWVVRLHGGPTLVTFTDPHGGFDAD